MTIPSEEILDAAVKLLRKIDYYASWYCASFVIITYAVALVIWSITSTVALFISSLFGPEDWDARVESLQD